MGALQLCLLLLFFRFTTSEVSFVYNGFSAANLSLYGASQVTHKGILEVTTDSNKLIGHAFYPSLLRFKDINSSVISFSTTFVFSISPKYPGLGGHGLAFVVLSTKEPRDPLPNQYLGLPNLTSNSEYSTQILAVEFDVVQNLEFGDINDNHVGIDIDSLSSNSSQPAAYYTNPNSNSQDNITLDLKNGDPVQAWIDYNSKIRLMTVTISPFGMPKPNHSLITFPVDLSSVLEEYMYVGFSASTGLLAAAHNILGWSFRIGGVAQDLDPSLLPSLLKPRKLVHKKGFAMGITLVCLTLVLLLVSWAYQVVRTRMNVEEVLEEWEVEYGARRFSYSELVVATSGFSEENLIGAGGFGSVYKGFVPSTGFEMAIKRISQDSRQGLREFVAEIMSMGRLRHRNLVHLHGWCRRNDELLLIYDYIPNGSLDEYLFDSHDKVLTWEQRYKILIGVAQALLYLHEECNQKVVHRDVKPSNILIDAELNAKLGDFGLARIYDHDENHQTTKIVGTLGYLAPELTRTGKATTSTDVYSYGALMLEVATGRRPIEPQRSANELVMVDWVRDLHSRGDIMSAVDPALALYKQDEVELVLGLGLQCSHPLPSHRPDMRKILQYLLHDAIFPKLPIDIHFEVPGLPPNSAYAYLDESDPSSSTMTSF